MNRTMEAKASVFNRQKLLRAVCDEAASLIGSLLFALMSRTAFDNYKQHHKSAYLFIGWMMAVFFVWAVSFIVRNVLRASRQTK